jgi:MscS family membrane protein
MEGTVQKIGWRTTRILTSCHRPLYVPNAIFLTVSVENNSRMLNYRIKQNIGIRYDDYKVLPSIITQIKQLLQTDERLDLTQTNYVNITEFAASAITVQIYVYTRTTEQNEYQDIQQDILLKILQIVEKNQAQTAFPTSTIHVPNSITISQSGK